MLGASRFARGGGFAGEAKRRVVVLVRNSCWGAGGLPLVELATMVTVMN